MAVHWQILNLEHWHERICFSEGKAASEWQQSFDWNNPCPSVLSHPLAGRKNDALSLVGQIWMQGGGGGALRRQAPKCVNIYCSQSDRCMTAVFFIAIILYFAVNLLFSVLSLNYFKPYRMTDAKKGEAANLLMADHGLEIVENDGTHLSKTSTRRERKVK